MVVWGAVVVLTVLGALDVSTTVLSWLRPASPGDVQPVSDRLVEGVAVGIAVDYLSWDTDSRERRTESLRRRSSPGRNFDGWDGQGRQIADAAAVIELARSTGDRAVAAVRVRITPFAADSDGVPQGDRQATESAGRRQAPAGSVEGDPASGPVVPAPPGWRARPARWVVLAVVLVEHGGRPVLAAVPALVGDEGTTGPRPLPPDGQGTDEVFTRDTEQAARTFMDAVAGGDLDFVRAPHARIPAVNGSARLVEFRRWRGLRAADGTPADQRAGTATVVWEFAEQSGRLTCSYRVGLRRQDDRWLMTAIDIEPGNTPS